MPRKQASKPELKPEVVQEETAAQGNNAQPEPVTESAGTNTVPQDWSQHAGPMDAAEVELAALKLQYAALHLAKESYKGLAQQGIAEISYFCRTHGTEYAKRRLGEMSAALAAVKDVN